jgi:hypothetical protein
VTDTAAVSDAVEALRAALWSDAAEEQQRRSNEHEEVRSG